MADIYTALANPTTKVTAALASGSTITSPHPALHVEEREMLEALRVKAVHDDATAAAVVYGNAFRGTAIAPPATSGYGVGNAFGMNWLCDGVGDNVEIQSAIDAVSVTGGGCVQLMGPLFMQAASIKLRTGVWLRGEGLGTILRASGNFVSGNYGQIMLYTPDAATTQETHATKLSDFTLHGAGKNCHGIHYIADKGQTFDDPDPDTNPDPYHIVRDMYIYGQGNSAFAGHGLITEGGNLRACRYDTIRFLGQSGCCVWVNNSVDSHYTNLDMGSAGGSGVAWSTSDAAPVGSGIHINGDDNFFLNCKSWFSDGDGWYVHGVRNKFTGCGSQDNGGYGWNCPNGKNVYSTCTADSNGRSNGASSKGRDGWNIASDTNSCSACSSYDKGESSTTAWQQQYGVRTGGGLTNSDISFLTYGNALGSSTGTPAGSSRVFIAGT